MTRRLILVAIALAFLPFDGVSAKSKNPVAATFVAVTERVHDGDTVIYPQGSCRLAGIDAPELSQPLGDRARQALTLLLGDRPTLVLVLEGKDRYGRMLCLILAADGYLANLTMVESGFALPYLGEALPFWPGLLESAARAKADRRGLWGLTEFEQPWHYRARIRGRR